MSYRMAGCVQVMKNILDKLEREERQEQKRQRKAESVEEKQKRLAATKLQNLLFKHKESLKKEMMKKRALMEKAISTEIQVGVHVDVYREVIAYLEIPGENDLNISIIV